MTTKISSREVLAYLNDLGYNNINPQQLKEFVQDLKKLIKYEERRKSKTDTTSADSTRNEISDIFSVLYKHETLASKAKVVPKKESVISVQIKKSKSQNRCVEHNKENAVTVEATKSSHSGKSDKSDVNVENVEKEVQNQPKKQSKTDIAHDAKRGENGKKINPLKAKASFIRPPIQTSQKSDPVALYHQYQAEWKRVKIPGEDSRTDLRWAIRERMLGGPR